MIVTNYGGSQGLAPCDATKHRNDEHAIPVNVRGLTCILILACLIIEVGLFLGDLLINYGKLTELSMIHGLFNITREDGLASLFNVVFFSGRLVPRANSCPGV